MNVAHPFRFGDTHCAHPCYGANPVSGPMKVRYVRKSLIALAIFELGMAAGLFLPRARGSQSHSASGSLPAASGDWSKASETDLAMAGLFITARDRGIGAAMDSLRALGKTDSAFREMSPTMLHHVAHSLGRFVEERSGYDPHVMLQCRVGYAAGCYHGVMESYFSSQPNTDSAALATLCGEIAPKTPALAARECAHGMGHGLMALPGHTTARALASCDYLERTEFRRECYDGVFMTTMNSPGAGEAHSMAGMSMDGDHHLTQATDTGSDAGCGKLPERYLASCWAYRPGILISRTRGDFSGVIQECDTTPFAARGACYYGVGKQGVGSFPTEFARVAAACRKGDPRFAPSCRAGIVAYYTDIDWTADRAVAFCSSLESEEKSDCYRSLGADMRLMQPDRISLERECEKAEVSFVLACMAGAAGEK